MNLPIKRLTQIAAVLAIAVGLSASAAANPFVVDASGANLSVAQGCLLSESFCDPTDANYVDLVSSALGTGSFDFSALAVGAQTLTFSLSVPVANLDDGGAGNPVMDAIELTTLNVSGTVNVNVTSFFPGLFTVAMSGANTVNVSAVIETFQGGSSIGGPSFFSTPGVGLTGLNCNLGIGGGLCGITLAPPGDLTANPNPLVSLESFAFNPTLALPEPTVLALLGTAGLALIGRRRRA